MDPNPLNNDHNSQEDEISRQIALPPGRNPNKAIKKIVWKIVVFVLISIFVLGAILVFINLSGGISGVISNMKSKPKPNSSAVKNKRNSAKIAIEKEFKELESTQTLTYYGESTKDVCYDGQNNLWVRDGYANRCDYRATRYYGFNDDYRNTMLKYDEDITTLGWKQKSIYDGVASIISQYDSNYKNKESYGGGSDISGLPTVRNGYIKNDVKMGIASAEKEDANGEHALKTARVSTTESLLPYYKDEQFQDMNKLFQLITTDNQYVLAISLESNYFEN